MRSARSNWRQTLPMSSPIGRCFLFSRASATEAVQYLSNEFDSTPSLSFRYGCFCQRCCSWGGSHLHSSCEGSCKSVGAGGNIFGNGGGMGCTTDMQCSPGSYILTFGSKGDGNFLRERVVRFCIPSLGDWRNRSIIALVVHGANVRVGQERQFGYSVAVRGCAHCRHFVRVDGCEERVAWFRVCASGSFTSKFGQSDACWVDLPNRQK